VFYRDRTIFVVYVDDGIFASPDVKEIDKTIQDLQKAGFDVKDKGDIKDYLGVHVTKVTDGKLKLWQPHLIQQILNDVNLPKNVTRTVPALSSKILQRDENAPSYRGSFHYRSIIGKLNFLEKTTRTDILAYAEAHRSLVVNMTTPWRCHRFESWLAYGDPSLGLPAMLVEEIELKIVVSRLDIAYAVHQCARFCEDPKKTHYEAVIHLHQGAKIRPTVLFSTNSTR
jgi:hypothetical protein